MIDTLYYIRTDNTATNCKLHTFANTNSRFLKNQLFQACACTCRLIFNKIGLVDQSKRAHKFICKISLLSCINLQLSIEILKKIDYFRHASS